MALSVEEMSGGRYKQWLVSPFRFLTYSLVSVHGFCLIINSKEFIYRQVLNIYFIFTLSTYLHTILHSTNFQKAELNVYKKDNSNNT